MWNMFYIVASVDNGVNGETVSSIKKWMKIAEMFTILLNDGHLYINGV